MNNKKEFITGLNHWNLLFKENKNNKKAYELGNLES